MPTPNLGLPPVVCVLIALLVPGAPAGAGARRVCWAGRRPQPGQERRDRTGPRPPRGQDLKPRGRYLSTLDLVTVALASVMDAGTSFSTRSLMPLLWPMSRARLIADDAMLGGYVTVALSTVLSALMAFIALRDPAPPTMKNSLRPAWLIAARTPTPWSSSWFQMASIFGAACSRFDAASSPPSTVKSAATRLLTLSPQSASASAKPLLRSWVSGRESMPAISATTASGLSPSREQTYVPAETPMP